MARRLVTAAIGLPLLLGVASAGPPYLTSVVAVAAALGWIEYYRMFATQQSRGVMAYGGLWAALLVVSAQFDSPWGTTGLPTLTYVTLGCGALPAAVWLLGRPSEALPRLRLALGPVYLGFFMAHAVALRQADFSEGSGFHWLLFALLTTFATDSGAYLVGRSLGRHPMAPTISPAKTWEGAAGGFLGAMAAGAGLAALLGLPMAATGIAAAVGVAAQAGDLLESKLKRTAGVKDAGSILPGHGGLLDRLDSLVLTIPLVYYLALLVVAK